MAETPEGDDHSTSDIKEVTSNIENIEINNDGGAIIDKQKLKELQLQQLQEQGPPVEITMTDHLNKKLLNHFMNHLQTLEATGQLSKYNKPGEESNAEDWTE